MTTTTLETAATISIDDLRAASNQIDTELAQIFAGVFAQHRTWRKAAAYTDALTACDTPVKTCWDLAEKAGHHTPGLFQSLIAENQGDHPEIWKRIATAVPRLVSCPADDPLGPGVAVDETAQPKRGHHTVGTGTQWAGCLGQTTNCVTSVLAQLSHTLRRDLDLPRAVSSEEGLVHRCWSDWEGPARGRRCS